MTNREKNKKRFDELWIGDLSDFEIARHIAVRKSGDVDLCEYTPCHDCIFKYGHCTEDSEKWLTDEAETEKKVKSKKTPPRIVVYRDGDTVTVKDLETGEEASAVCSKKDTFDLHTGAFIAMSRLTHFDTDIRLMRLEMEQLDSYISDIKMRFGALMGEGYKYQDFDEEDEE